MKTQLQINPVREPVHRVGVYHDQLEDFSVYRPATFVQRWYALAIDLALAGPLDILIHLPFDRYLERLSAYGHENKYYALMALLTSVPWIAFFVTPTVLWGQTLGKRIVGVRVIRANFAPKLTVGQVLFRESFGKLLSVLSCGVGFLMALFTNRRRALQDYVADTVVVAYRDRY